MATTGFWPPDPLRSLAGQASHVELKVVVPRRGGRSLGIDTESGPSRRVYYLDTEDLALYRHDLIVRFRDRRRRRDDAVIKLRPVDPGGVPRWLRTADRFRMEIDALPGHAVCSGALKQRLRRNDVARTLRAGRPLTGLLSAPQRRLFAKYAPAGVRLRDLVVYGPIDVRCLNVELRGLDRGLTVERWRYPNGADLLELSTKCPVDEAAAVASRMSKTLRAYGVAPADLQRTKTEMAFAA